MCNIFQTEISKSLFNEWRIESIMWDATEFCIIYDEIQDPVAFHIMTQT